MSISRPPNERPEATGLGTSDDERLVDPDDDDALPPILDVEPDVPVPDVIDQRRTAPFDDEQER